VSDAVLTMLISSAAAVIVAMLTSRIDARARLKQATASETSSTSTAAEANTRANLALVEPLTKRLEGLEREVQAERRARLKSDERLEKLMSVLRSLLAQMEENAIVPDVKPEVLEELGLVI